MPSRLGRQVVSSRWASWIAFWASGVYGIRAGVLVEQRRDLLQSEPQASQRQDLVEPPHVLSRIQAVTGRRPLPRHQEADIVVVVQRPDRRAGHLRELSDLPAPVRALIHRPRIYALT